MLVQLFNYAENINVYYNGDVYSYAKADDNYVSLLIAWQNTICESLEMPAYCVSLDADTKEAIKFDVWLEFCFPKVLEYEGMNFQKLLINVKSDNLGCDLIRYNPQFGYDGRCYHLRLNSNMTEIYDCISDILNR